VLLTVSDDRVHPMCGAVWVWLTRSGRTGRRLEHLVRSMATRYGVPLACSSRIRRYPRAFRGRPPLYRHNSGSATVPGDAVHRPNGRWSTEPRHPKEKDGQQKLTRGTTDTTLAYCRCRRSRGRIPGRSARQASHGKRHRSSHGVMGFCLDVERPPAARRRDAGRNRGSRTYAYAFRRTAFLLGSPGNMPPTPTALSPDATTPIQLFSSSCSYPTFLFSCFLNAAQAVEMAIGTRSLIPRG
jgi:hypothetical protein